MTKLLRIIVTMMACDASAHEIETHRNITAQAMAYLQNIQPTKYACAADINTALQTGAADEDSTFPDVNSFPLGRFYFHFFGNNRQPLNGLGQSEPAFQNNGVLMGVHAQLITVLRCPACSGTHR